MDVLDIKFKKLTPDARLPHKASEHAAGYDIYAMQDAVMEPGEIKMISTGLAMEMPNNLEAQVRPRSGLAIKHGITVINSPGTIDSDYRGEVKVGLINLSKTTYTIESGMRIAQMVFSRVLPTRIIETVKLSDTDRGAGGFGSTGV
jgi:dUTP pyrophosphatase